MIRFPDRDPTEFCNSEPDPDWTGFWKNSTWSDIGYPNCFDHCSIMLNQRIFFGYKPDWIKYLDRSTGLGSDRITQWKFWTGLGLQKSPICSTLLRSRRFLSGVEFGVFIWLRKPIWIIFLHRTPKLGILTRACWNGRISFETFIETDNSCCVLEMNGFRFFKSKSNPTISFQNPIQLR